MNHDRPIHSTPKGQVALVCASSAVPEERLARGGGARPGPSSRWSTPSCYYENRHGYFAADDAQRAGDLQSAFADDTIAGVLAIRGGYGAHRLLPLLDLDAIARTPKLFCGYSDVTALPTLSTSAAASSPSTPCPPPNTISPWTATAACLRRALFGPVGAPENPEGIAMTALQKQLRRRAPLRREPLPLLCASPGLPWEIDTPGASFCSWRTSVSRPIRVDAMLTNCETPVNSTIVPACCWGSLDRLRA